MVSATKDPVKVRAGLAGSRIRWGPVTRVARLDELTDPQRRLVLALVAAAKEEAAPDVSTDAASAGGQANDRTAT